MNLSGMKTLDNFFNSATAHLSQLDRQSKIMQLKRPVYAKKLKQKKLKRVFTTSQFVPISCRKGTFKNNLKDSQNLDLAVRRSKSYLFFKNKNSQLSDQNQQKANLGDLAIQKIQYQKDSNKLAYKKNSFMKDLFRQKIDGNQLSVQNRNSSISEYYNKIMRAHTNFFKKVGEKYALEQNNDNLRNPEVFSDRKQKVKFIQFIKKQQIQEKVINELNDLRKKRKTSGFQSKNHQNNKKQSLIRKNSLFLMGFLKQRQKKDKSDKSPHINNDKLLTCNIKIKQNIQLKKTFSDKINFKIIQRNRSEVRKQDKINAVFNSMKIQPW